MGWSDRLRHPRTLLVAGLLASAVSAPAATLAAPGGPPALAVLDQPTVAYLGRPFAITVALVDLSGVVRMSLKFGGAGEWYVRSSVMARWFGEAETTPAVAWASRPTPIARFSVR